MIIEIKYNVGDNIRYTYSDYVTKYVKCPCCDGSGYIVGKNGKVYDCPNCDPDHWGQIKDGYDIFKHEVTGTISAFHVNYDSTLKKPIIYYSTPQDSKIFQEDIIERVVSD